MQYKKHFTTEELNEILEWFDTNRNKLPNSLKLDNATYIKDFKRTLQLYYDIAREHRDNPTYSGQIYHLFQMKEAVLKSWQEQSEQNTTT